MARCGCGGDRCRCTLVAGDGATVEGTGSPIDPYVVSADTTARVVTAPGDCVTLTGDGSEEAPLEPALTIDPAEGNGLTCGPDGLFATGGTVEAGCGLVGEGTAAAPLTAATTGWAYDCPIDEAAGLVYCDDAGVLRGEPRSAATYVQDSQNESYDPTEVPADYNVPIETRTLEIVNPDPCREAFVICEVEVDIDFDLPPGSSAAGGIQTDEMQFFANTGSEPMTDVHGQVTKVYNRVIPPGETLDEPLQIVVGRGTGGATYNRVQTFMRAFVFNL